MIRVLIFILLAASAAAALTYLLSLDGRLEATAFGQRFDIHNGVAALLLLLGVALVAWLTSLVKDLSSLPGKIRQREALAKRERGARALARGFEAAAAGDAAAAQRNARIASQNLEDASATRLLTAQAAQLSGDEKAAQESFSAMLEAPDTEFLGLRGLYAQAMRAGDREAARGYAERAFRLKSNAPWAFESVLELGLERGAWGETREAIRVAAKNGLLPADKAQRGEAALLTADAHAVEAAGEGEQALKEASAAVKLAPGFAPAAVLAARLLAGSGKTGKAAKIIETAFAEDPHPALSQAHGALYREESAERRAEAMHRLAERRPDAREAKLLLARRAMLLGDFEQAIEMLEPLLVERASARDCALMAEAVEGAYGDAGETQAEEWLRRAAAAPRDPLPGADGAFHFTREGWARIVREYMEHARLAPPPFEDAPPGLPLEEVKLLAAPPAPAVEEEEGAAESVEPVGEEMAEDGPEPATKSEPPEEDAMGARKAEAPPAADEKTEDDHAREIDAARRVS